MSVDTRSWNISSWYPTNMITYDEAYEVRDLEITEEFKRKLNSVFTTPFAEFVLKKPSLLLTKCINCEHCFKRGDGTYLCKYSIHGGTPEKATCHYERKQK